MAKAEVNDKWREGVDENLLKLYDKLEACQWDFDPLLAELAKFRRRLMDQKMKLMDIAKNGGVLVSQEEIKVLVREIIQGFSEIFDKENAIKARLNKFLAE